jgi:hypothetical protein
MTMLPYRSSSGRGNLFDWCCAAATHQDASQLKQLTSHNWVQPEFGPGPRRIYHDTLFARSGFQRVTNQSSGAVIGCWTRGPGQGVRGMGMSGATSADRGWGPINRGAEPDSINTQAPCI